MTFHDKNKQKPMSRIEKKINQRTCTKLQHTALIFDQCVKLLSTYLSFITIHIHYDIGIPSQWS